MRVTRKQAEINRQRIIESAIRLFAERGVDGVGVAEVMRDAGFTHGGFYNHFTSKDDLVLEACSVSFERALCSLRDRQPPRRAQDAEFGACLSAAMLCEASRGNTRLSYVHAKGVSEFLDVLAHHYGDRERASVALACFVGAQVLSRAVEIADRELADQLGAVRYPAETQPRVQPSS